MPLVQCLDCGAEHSDAAVTCPSCGRPNRPAKARHRKLPTNKSLYALNLMLGMVFFLIGSFIASQLLSAVLMFPSLSIFRALFYTAIVVFLIDLVLFDPAKTGDRELENGKFSYFIIGPFLRLLPGDVKKSLKPWIISAGIFVIISIPLSAFVGERLDSNAFLKNSDTVVDVTRASLEQLESCPTLSQCPEEYKKIADTIRSYAIPNRAQGFVSLISRDNGVYKSISTDDRRYFYSQRIPQPALKQGEEDKNKIDIPDFHPLFNSDFGEVVLAFRPDSVSSVQIANADTANGDGSRLFRSLHRVDIKGRPLIVYIVSDQGFLFSPRQTNVINRS